MKHFCLATLILAALCLSACTVAPASNDASERRAAIAERNASARGYSEFLRARYAALTNDPHQAAMYYRKAALSNPHDHDLLERAVFTSLISGDVEAAIDTAQEAPSPVLAQTSLPRIVLGTNALKKSRSGRVRQVLQSDTSSLFNDTIATGLVAWAVMDDHGLEAALQVLNSTEADDSLLDGLTHSTRGMLQLHSKQDDAALSTFQTMWKDGVRLASTTEYMARLLHRSGEEDEAIRVLKVFSTRVGQNAAIEALLQDMRNGEAITLDRPSLVEGAALAIYTPAAALATQTDSDLAGVYFALALELDPNLHVARTLWGDALDNANRRDDAIEILTAVPESSAFFSTSRGQIAWALRREDRNDDALTTAREALSSASDRNLKIQLGDLFRSLDQLPEAEQIFTEIIDADTEQGVQDWRLFYARGAAREQMDRWTEAETDLLAALELAPDQPALLNYLGYSWIDRGERLTEGFDMIKRAVALRPNAGFIVDSLGWAYYKLGDYNKAVTHLERAVELSPSEAVLNEHLGDAYWRVGRRLEAGFQWSRAIRLEPESDNVILLEAKLETGLDQARALVASRTSVITP